MEELYMPSNDGELSFVETDGNIVLEQGCQSFISSAEQNPQNIIYTQHQIQEQQVYIIQPATLQATDPQQHQYTYSNMGANSINTYNPVPYSTGPIAQAPQQIIHQKQIVQQGMNRNEEYSILQEVVQPQQQRILHIVPPQQRIQLQNVVEIPVQHQQQDLQVQKQLQQKHNSMIIPQGAQLTFVPKASNIRTAEEMKTHPVVSAYHNPNTQQKITLAVQSPVSSVPQRQQRPQRGGSFTARIQGPNSSLVSASVRPRGAGLVGQRPRATLVTNICNDNFLKQLEQKTSLAVRGKMRGAKTTAAQQRKLCSQQILGIGNPSNDNNNDGITQSSVQGSPPNTKNTINLDDDTSDNGQNSVIAAQPKSLMSQQVNFTKRNEQQQVSVSKQNLTTEVFTNSQAKQIMQIKEKQGQSNLFPVCVVDRKGGQRVLVVSSNIKGNISGSADSTSKSSASESENTQRLVYIKGDSPSSNNVEDSSNHEVIPLSSSGKGIVSTNNNKMISRNIGRFTLSEKVHQMKKPIEQFAIRHQQPLQQHQQQQLQHQIQQQQKKENLVLCSHCGIQTETFAFCSSCKHPLNRNLSKEMLSHQSDTISSSNMNCGARLIQSEKKSSLIRGRGRGRGGRGRGRSYDEPVILTLSSDEEEEESTTLKEHSSTFSSSTIAEQFLFNSPVVNKKEPVISANFDSEVDINKLTLYCIGKPNSFHSFSSVSLKCRSIRIGSYKVTPIENVEIKQNEYIKMVVPPFAEGDTDPVVLKIPFVNILTILGHFNNSLPVLFIYLRPTPAMQIRKQLKMVDKNRYYYNPASTEESHKRITILPDKFEEEIKKVLKDQFSSLELEIKGERRKLFHELDQREANYILVKSSPQDVQSLLPKSLRTDYETTTLFVFPPPPQKGGITITTDDYCCLEEEQFLNDVILDFYLKWLMLSYVDDEDRERTHVFSTFFYKRLTSKPKGNRRPPNTEEESKLTPAQQRHARVQSWTKNVDIFSKDFILIPINEHSHWFLAVICFPGLDGPVRKSDGKPVILSNEKVKKNHTAKPKAKVEIPIIDDGEWSDRDEAEGDEEELNDDDEEEEDEQEQQQSSSEDGQPPLKRMKHEEEGESLGEEGTSSTPKESKPPPPKKDSNIELDAIKQPCILIFDSLSGASRSRIVATLRDYLAIEHQKKKKKEKHFTKDTMKGACPKVPQQMNFSDCGLFTLQFAESFFKNPIKDFRLPIRTLTDWFNQDIVARKRKSIAMLIKSLMDKHKPNHNIQLPQIHFNTPKEPTLSNSPSNIGESEPKDSEKTELSNREPSQSIKYEELLQESQEPQSGIPLASRKININLIKRNASPNAVSETQSNPGNLPNSKEVIFNIGPSVGVNRVPENPNKETSVDRGGSKINVNRNNNSTIDQQASEEDIIGKSPGRIEIMDDSELLLVFNTDPNQRDNSQVTEINIQSSDSSPEFSESFASIEEPLKSNSQHVYSGASSDTSSISSRQHISNPNRKVFYQNPSENNSLGMEANSFFQEKSKHMTNEKSIQEDLPSQSLSEACSSVHSSGFQEKQSQSKTQLQKERSILQQKQQQQKILLQQHMTQEKKLLQEKSMASTITSDQISAEQTQMSQQAHVYQQNTQQNQNKNFLSQNKLMMQKQQQLLQQHKQRQQHLLQQKQQMLQQKQQQLQQQKQQQLLQHKEQQWHQQQQMQQQLQQQKQQHLHQQTQPQHIQQQNQQSQLHQQYLQQHHLLQQNQQQQQKQENLIVNQSKPQQNVFQNVHHNFQPISQQGPQILQHQDHQLNVHQEQLSQIKPHQLSQEEQKELQPQQMLMQHQKQQFQHVQSNSLQQQQQLKQFQLHQQKENIQRGEQQQRDLVYHQNIGAVEVHEQLANKKLCTEDNVNQRFVQKSQMEGSVNNIEDVLQIENEAQSEQKHGGKICDKYLVIDQEELIIDQQKNKDDVSNFESRKYNENLRNSNVDKIQSSITADNTQRINDTLQTDTENVFASVSGEKHDIKDFGKNDEFQKFSSGSEDYLEAISGSKSGLDTHMSNKLSPSSISSTPTTMKVSTSGPSFSQQTLPTSSVGLTSIASTTIAASRSVSSSSSSNLSSIFAMPTLTPSRTTSRGRIVNTPMKYRDMEDVYVSSKRTRGSVRGSRVRNSRIPDQSPMLKNEDHSQI